MTSGQNDSQPKDKARPTVLLGATAVIAVIVTIGTRFLFGKPHPYAKTTDEVTAGEHRESAQRRSYNGTGSSASANSAKMDPAPAQGMPPGMDPRRTAEIRRALAIISDAGVGGLWAPPPTPVPVASDTSFMPEPEMTQNNQADAGLGQYIAKRIHEDFYPLASQCYDAALAKTPDLHGRMTLRMTIVGDHKVGAVIDSTDIDDSSQIKDPVFRTCLKESAMTVNFAPPPEGTKEITSTFSMTFAPTAPEGK